MYDLTRCIYNRQDVFVIKNKVNSKKLKKRYTKTS